MAEVHTLESRWNEKIPKLKKLYPKLTDGDVKYSDGGEKALLDNLMKKTGLKRQEMSDMLDSL